MIDGPTPSCLNYISAFNRRLCLTKFQHFLPAAHTNQEQLGKKVENRETGKEGALAIDLRVAYFDHKIFATLFCVSSHCKQFYRTAFSLKNFAQWGSFNNNISEMT